ncbi:hypothetical protein Tmar_1836 [Thermaerobacter marianensis DSM 12885]|uniref:GH29D-like beta-sandwich domain-containing protein n=1 Tax=Thermaerobacter marianensis (strain ATCC 700841 / DSM 12885 / JCM 10246 / 7p75a) TaxID=644966 RepID=E6SIC6_THEM7|nr:DUF499 domain-containing protein [Thermaerobacter marianensis]ADU51937.1 hypothetical protein Tmar_1836 [Thermaerobacter marianensis DSM 12885]
MKSLYEACKPRDWVFDPSVRDTVYDLDDLDRIDPERFFTENYVTQGMRQLLTEAFKRLEGKSESASGAFLLSQSMGGGKTHNLLALGLLAKHPRWRRPVMGSFYTPGPLGAVRVVAFSGRKTHTPHGIWGEIATQLNRREVFRNFYSPLLAPGVEDWVELLRGEPVLILLDELPPYFQAARAVPVGMTTLDHLTTTALANLLVAVAGGKLPNVCLVLTDLRASAYQAGSAAIGEALQNLAMEANRTVTHINPVQLNSNEIYHILRTRLFERVAPPAAIEAVADAYAAAVNEARRLDLTTASPQALRSEIIHSYPFHPGLRDLFARFRENPGYQQTRALIRIMRIVVAELWQSGRARQRFLIAPHHLDLGRPELVSEIRQINATLENAVAHDVVDENGGAVAQQIDRELGGSDARDAATLILLSSLSQAVNPTLGLDRSEIVGYLAEPGRNLSAVREALDRLQARAWYLHVTGGGKILFKNVENLNAKLESYASGLRDERELELRERLQEMFAPKVGGCYQEVYALPALDQVELQPHRVALVIFRPRPGTGDEVRRFWEYQLYKNRVLFLTGNPVGYERVLERAAYLRAARQIVAEFRQQGVPEHDPQFLEAGKILARQEALFYMACREVFQQLYYPHRNRLVVVDLDPRYVANHYEGEQQIVAALQEVQKYVPDASRDPSSFRQMVERNLWPEGQQEVRWTEIKRRAATDPGWILHHPQALDDLKDEMIRRDLWRDAGDGYVRRGPFPKPATDVQIQVLSRDPQTGEVTLRVRPLHGDVVHYSCDGAVSPSSPRLDGAELRTRALQVAFLAVDSTGEHPTGEPRVWTNTVEVKYRFFQQGGQRMLELQAVPWGEIRYTLDGSSPELSGQPYTGPMAVPPGTRVVLARAWAGPVVSETVRIDVPAGDQPVTVDPRRPALWKRAFKLDGTAETYWFLELAERHRALLCGPRVDVGKEQRFLSLAADEKTQLPPQKVVEIARWMAEILPGGLVTLEVEGLAFQQGQDLSDLVAELRQALQPGEVQQP